MSTSVERPSLERPWMKPVLLLAGAYNLLWGLFSIAWPGALFSWCGMEPPRYPELWQCIGMIVGVYGIGYVIAAFDPLRHWPIVLVGLLGKIFGPVGFAGALIQGSLPIAFGATILTNDLIWWLPFSLILWSAFKQATTMPDLDPNNAVLAELKSESGQSFTELSQQQPVFAVLLRHAGCTFHREALADLKKAQSQIEESGARLAVVHMGAGENEIETAQERYLLDEVAHFSDPDRKLYRYLGLPRGTIGQLFGPRVFQRGFSACVLKGHGVGTLKGDGFQLGGMALIDQGQVVWSRPLSDAAERPDYVGELQSALSQT